MLGVRDGVGAERFSSAIVAMAEGEGEGGRDEKPLNDLARLNKFELERLGPSQFGNTHTFAECRESATYFKLSRVLIDDICLFTRSAIQLTYKLSTVFFYLIQYYKIMLGWGQLVDYALEWLDSAL